MSKIPHNIALSAQITKQQMHKLDQWVRILGRPWTRSKLTAELIEHALPEPLTDEESLKVKFTDALDLDEESLIPYLATLVEGKVQSDGFTIKAKDSTHTINSMLEHGLLPKLWKIRRFVSTFLSKSS